MSEMRKQANRMTFGEVCSAPRPLTLLIPHPPHPAPSHSSSYTHLILPLHTPHLTPTSPRPLSLQIEEDAYQDDLGFSMGQMGKSTTGRVRGPAVDQRTQVTISKRLQV